MAHTELILSGTTTQFQIQNNTITITTPIGNPFTGSIELRQCIANTGCNYIGQLLIDTRTQRLYIPSSETHLYPIIINMVPPETFYTYMQYPLPEPIDFSHPTERIHTRDKTHTGRKKTHIQTNISRR